MVTDNQKKNENESNKNEPRLQGVNRSTVVTPVKSAIDAIQAQNNVSTFLFNSIIRISEYDLSDFVSRIINYIINFLLIYICIS